MLPDSRCRFSPNRLNAVRVEELADDLLHEYRIMKIGGWKTRSVFERYAIVSRTDIADAMLKLQATETALGNSRERISHELNHAARRTTLRASPDAKGSS